MWIASCGFPGGWRKFGFDFQFRKCQPQPVMNASVTFFRFQQIPLVAGRHNKAVSPVRVMRHNAAASRTADERAQMRRAFDLGKYLEISKRRRRFRPAIKTQNRFAKPRNIFKQRLVQRHVERRAAFAGMQKKPIH